MRSRHATNLLLRIYRHLRHSGALFLVRPGFRNSRISAAEVTSPADNFLQKQQKQRGRPFEKGRSGNPAGRPRGSRNRSTLAAQMLLQGEAEAEIIFKKGEAEAKALNVKAEAYQEWNQAAVVDRLISGLPEVVRALSEPLSKVDKITIVSTGNGDAAGAYKITGDVTKMAAQVPALFEALSGMQISELFGKVKAMGDKKAIDAK